MSDYLMRIISQTRNVRALACVTTDLVREGCRMHQTLPTASIALGRALTGAALMGALLKRGQRVAMKFEGNGPLRKIIVEGESDGRVSGFVAVPAVDLPPRHGKFDVAGALGRAGFLTVTKDLGLATPYSGTVQLLSGEIAEDLALYLTESEQIPSAVALGVHLNDEGEITRAGGLLLQAIPPYDDAALEILTRRISDMPPVTAQLRAGVTPEEMLATLFVGIPYEPLERTPLRFECTCSVPRIERMLISLGPTELKLLAEQGGTEVTCEYCRKRYDVTAPMLEKLQRELSTAPASRRGKGEQ